MIENVVTWGCDAVAVVVLLLMLYGLVLVMIEPFVIVLGSVWDVVSAVGRKIFKKKD